MAKFVRDIMVKKIITLDPEDSIDSARKLMMKQNIHSILIPPPRGGKLWRIFTETDLLIALDMGKDLKNIPIGEFASIATKIANLDWTIEKAREQMVMNGVKHLPVVDDSGKVVGVISSSDIIRAY